MIVALGLNIIGVTKIKVANYLPAIIIAPILCSIVTLI
ncbi:putative membrane protein YqgA involved in biofilm formation [Sedimentibacter acidaminivorans]|uniref:Membrane protein YqgA involved in biofilm formation n=1 Tax=Sedimentibacter acidaminivorans TaxID=913099 RepID=A0ABS4GA54_9FIRM|nr:putative membrane protein YqgA involved in biofilm formation [Sedimentibacter acidaminivorans]